MAADREPDLFSGDEAYSDAESSAVFEGGVKGDLPSDQEKAVFADVSAQQLRQVAYCVLGLLEQPPQRFIPQQVDRIRRQYDVRYGGQGSRRGWPEEEKRKLCRSIAATYPFDEELLAALPYHLLILGEIGSGGLGRVFLACDLQHDRLITLKWVNFHRDGILQDRIRDRFRREAIFLLDTQHASQFLRGYPAFDGQPVQTALFGEQQGILSAEWEGTDLSRLPQLSVLPFFAPEGELSICGLMKDLLQSLVSLHERGIIHRDVKPPNLYLHEQQLRLGDFGTLWWPIESLQDEQRTRLAGLLQSGPDGVVPGTPLYLAPEVIGNARILTTASDVYSAGLVFFRLLTGRLPFPPQDDVEGYFQQVMFHVTPCPSDFSDLIPQELDDLVMQMLCKLHKERISASDALQKLTEIEQLYMR